MAESKEKRTLFILYILGIYILFQASWWAYHLIDLNGEMYEMKSIMTGIDHSKIYQTKVWMIIGEGSIFLILLGLGFWQIKKNISKELRLARMEKTFLLSVTHELKTPIAAVKLFLETLKTRKLQPEQSAKIIEDALKETTRLQTLSENILLATRLDQMREKLLDEDIELSEVIQQCTTRYRSLFPDRKIEMSIQEKIHIKGDVQFIQAMTSNLLENALKYSPSHEPIEVILKKENGIPTLEYRDFGTGIPGEEKQRVFEKFYRIGNEDTRKTKGTGLGLYIVRNIVKLHGGSIEIEPNIPHGSIFKITLPKTLN
jgi:signal transduction histidine kinase